MMKKIAVGILGATGMVGQKFVELLISHPWFEITALAASDRSAGRSFQDAANWRMAAPLPEKIASMPIRPCEPSLPCDLVFSALDSSVAGGIEEEFAKAGYLVVSNCSSHRMASHVPLIVPEINADHLRLIEQQPYGKGAIITNPNCSVAGIALALKPLLDKWGIAAVHIVTLQALSGAGYPGIPSTDILDNVIPYIAGEEAKVETEPLKIMGSYQNNSITLYPMRISAHCNRVPVADGHLACISVKLNCRAGSEEIITAWQAFRSEPQVLELPSAPKTPLVYLENEKHPQPKIHRTLGEGMSVAIGRLRACSLLDWKFALLSHNVIRGAAGCALLNAELLVKKGYLKC